MGIDEQLVRIHGQAPMPGAVTHLKPAKPVCPEPRAAITRAGPPERDIRLAGQVFATAIGTVVVDHEEMTDPERSTMVEESWQPRPFVSNRGKGQDLPLGNRLRPVRHDPERMATSERTPQASAAFPVQSVSVDSIRKRTGGLTAGPRFRGRTHFS